MSNKKARHFHAGKLRKKVGGVEYVEVAESNGKVFVGRNGLVISPRRPSPYVPKGYGRWAYPVVNIGGTLASVHRMVYEVFVEAVPDGMEIDHINTVCHDNRVENLRVVSSKGSSANPLTRERLLAAVRVSIKKAQKVNEKPVVGRRVSDGFCVGPYASCREAALAVGVSYKALSQALRGKSKSSGGFTWREVSHGDHE